MALRYFKNKKNGELYVLFKIAINCTNSGKQEKIAVYRRDFLGTNEEDWFIRDLKEFYEKFEEV